MSDDRGHAWTALAIGACSLYFAARLVYFAVAIDPSVPPDETTHVGRVLAYAGTWGIPAPGPENYALGLLGERPFLYSWCLARLYALYTLSSLSPEVASGSGLVFLRLLNAALALGTLAFGLRFIRVVTPDRPTQVVFAVLLTNAMMFTGVGASVSYDNGTNLLAAASFYYLALLQRDRSAKALAALGVCAGLGCLTKASFLPLAALLGAAVLFHERRDLRALASRLLEMGRVRTAVLAAVALANLALYGGNLIEYGRLVPRFEQVVGVEAALQNRIFARDYILDGFREGRLELREAFELTSRIDHRADRESTRLQLARLQRRGDERISPPAYVAAWSGIMLDRTFGYFGHQVVRRYAWEHVLYAAVGLVALAFHGLARRREPEAVARSGAAIALAYAGVLLAIVNYPNYAERGLLDAGVQGRYLFPVWVPLVGWLACALTREAPKALRGPSAALACALFVWGDLPVFLLRAPHAFFAASP